MEEDPYSPRPVARWYMIAAIASVLFMLAACTLYVQHVTTNPAALPLDQRTAFEAMPLWVISAFGLSAVSGLVASLMLVFRRKLAQPLMLVSLVAMLAWLAGLFLLPNVRETSSSNDLAVAIIVAAVDWTIFWFARHSAQRGWLG